MTPADAARIRRLGLPPAWRKVFISPSPRARLQAVGQDAAGRWQYRYEEGFTRKRERAKYQRLASFADSLPAMRRRVAKDLGGRGLSRSRVMACALRVLSTCYVRPGSAVYARSNKSYGLATLRTSHVKVVGDRLVLDFPGKSGQRQHRELVDARVCRIVRRMLKAPGVEVFKYQDEQGAFVDVRRRHINDYIKDVMGDAFSAKDFRTWAGTLLCACALAQAGAHPEDTQAARRRKRVKAIQQTAAELGNTPSVCRSSYIVPSVLSAFDQGRVVDAAVVDLQQLAVPRTGGLHAAEVALMGLLEGEAL